MKLEEFKIKNFRSYKDQVTIKLDSFIAFVGRNDAGKSTVLDAMEIFFNQQSKIVKIDKEDVNIDTTQETV